MTLTTIATENKTMSSREISELTGKRHDHVMRDIKKLIDDDAINAPNFGLVNYTDAKGEQRPMFNLDKQASLVLVTGYNAKMRSAIIERWMELEKQAAMNQFAIPQTMGDALRLAADEMDKRVLAESERDHAIKTKMQISDKMTATAMATASAKSREAEALKVKLDESDKYSTILRQERIHGESYKWQPLKKYCTQKNLRIKRTVDGRFGEVNSYPAKAWKAVYDIDIAQSAVKAV